VAAVASDREETDGVHRCVGHPRTSLLFLNYYVSRNGGDTTYTAYRALVTVVHTDRGWLVSGIDTK
jgi:Mce-associated membrane protein